MEAKPVREIYVPTRVRLWAQHPNYVAVIKDEWDEKFLERYVGKTVTLKISGIYVTGTLIKVNRLDYCLDDSTVYWCLHLTPPLPLPLRSQPLR